MSEREYVEPRLDEVVTEIERERDERRRYEINIINYTPASLDEHFKEWHRKWRRL